MQLGRSPVYVPPIGIGTWAWGDQRLWEYGRLYQESDLWQAFTASLQLGLPFFDTAEVYGLGRSERFLKAFARRANRPDVQIASKFMPLPWRLGPESLLRALRASLHRLGVDRIDLYQIHWPFPPVSIETWMQGLADAVERGLTRSAGVSNFNPAQMRRAHAALASRGIPLASNQVHFSLLHRDAERNGLLAACQELDVTLIAYSPLEMGLLTGKYSAESPPPGMRGRMYGPKLLHQMEPLVQLMRQCGEAHGGKSPSQVALNWIIYKGALPIPGAKNARQLRDNAGALGWQLTPDEVAALDEVSAGIGDNRSRFGTS